MQTFQPENGLNKRNSLFIDSLKSWVAYIILEIEEEPGLLQSQVWEAQNWEHNIFKTTLKDLTGNLLF